MPRISLLLFLCAMLLLCVEARAQNVASQDPTTGNMSIVPANRRDTPLIRDPNLQHIGIEAQWPSIFPTEKNSAPAVVRIIGANEDLRVALFNNKRKGRFESSVAFQLQPFVEKQTIEVQIYAVEQNGQAIAPTPLAAPQRIALKKQGAVLPLTLEMKAGESLTCEIAFIVNGQERGRTRIRADNKGLSFTTDKQSQK